MPNTQTAEQLSAALAWIDEQADAMIERMMLLSAINSGTTNTAGVNRIAEELSALFSPLADSSESQASATAQRVDLQGNTNEECYGPILRFRKRPEAATQVLLVGHMDTVFPQDHPFQTPSYLSDNIIGGPGVADMKGGILVMLTALRAFERFQADADLGWTVMLNSDEETGSLGSAAQLAEEALLAHVGMIYEPALADGTLAGARKGSGNFTLVVEGLAAHAGREFSAGRNAILALNRLAAAIAELTDIDNGVTVNIARISGGTALNVVPGKAVCQFNIRCETSEDQQRLKARLDELVASANLEEGYRCDLSGGFSRPPKILSAANQLLMDWHKECGASLGVDVRYTPTGGCCDGNNLAAAGLPNIDTLGVCGANIHTQEEYMLVDSFAERVKMSFLLLRKLAAEGDAIKALRSSPQSDQPQRGLA